MRRGAYACGFCRFRKRRHSRGRSHAYTRLRLASGSVARTRALNAPQRRTLSLVFSYAAHPVGEPPMAFSYAAHPVGEPPMAAYEKRHPKVSFAVVVGLNRAADCVTARASNECVGGRPRADFAVSASVGIAAAELAGTWFDGKRRIFARKFSQFSPP